MTKRDDDPAPETVNAEQQDAEMQSQSVARDAMLRSTSALGLGQSKKPSSGLDPASEQDLVDHMIQMDTSGTIDMSAYSGEETMDDLENRYGRDGVADEDLADDDS
ncbi:hypothetical protein, partial [Novosphingobium naphthalenivorans]|uniref:hypothetical protein n=1 Tax=Novosphingobium naphthalenivorans TaxID=273168 RepID=UPI0008373E8E